MPKIKRYLIAQEAAELAKQWQETANASRTKQEVYVQERIARLLNHLTDKIVLTNMFDQSFRSHNHARVAD